MVENRGHTDAPRLNALQRAWLQEIGIDTWTLSNYASADSVDTGQVLAPLGELPSADSSAAGSAAQEARPADDSVPSLQRAQQALNSVAVITPQTPKSADLDAPANVKLTVETLDALRTHTEQCVACGLHEVRIRPVFGEGVEASPRWMFIGEAPGEYDDSMGRPFQGRAGELLRAMVASVGIVDTSPAYFTNALKCRPMGNRSPEPEEIAACESILRRQITLLRPGCLVAMGRVAAGLLLGQSGELDTLRGRVHTFTDDDGRDIPVVVTHHPASLLLHWQLKAAAWRDLNLLRNLGA